MTFAMGRSARLCISWLVILLMMCVCVQGAAQAPALQDYGLSGTVGGYPIVMIITVKDDADIVSAHYSYVSQRKNIPLRSQKVGSQFILEEPSGGMFRVHLTASGPGGEKPLTFYTATGLSGTWSKATRTLPVLLELQVAGASGSIKDCTLYPNRRPPIGPHFPDPGCEHTPDKAGLDTCIARPFTSNDAVLACVTNAMAPCKQDQFDTNFCVGNIEAYLTQILEQRLGRVSGRDHVTPMTYSRWSAAQEVMCNATSEFSPDGSGYGADIGFCMAAHKLRLLQNNLIPSSAPIRKRVKH